MMRSPRPAPRYFPPNIPHEPTPDEIRAACERIREGWGESESRKRAGLPPEGTTLQLSAIALGVLDGRR